MTAVSHPFEAAIGLVPEGEGAFRGATSPAYANVIGPYGGIVAAQLLNAARSHPARAGEALALTVNYAGPLAEGPFRIAARPVRTNRSTQHWWMELTQSGEVAATASAVFGARRATWSSTEIAPPDVPPPAALPRSPCAGRPAWFGRYELRVVRGDLPDFARPAEAEAEDSETCLWVRDDPPRPLDFAALAALCDVFYPRIYRRRPRWVPAATVTLTTYFHADAATLARQADRHVLAVARALRFGGGYADQTAEIWGDDGALLATSFQLVYFKE